MGDAFAYSWRVVIICPKRVSVDVVKERLLIGSNCQDIREPCTVRVGAVLPRSDDFEPLTSKPSAANTRNDFYIVRIPCPWENYSCRLLVLLNTWTTVRKAGEALEFSRCFDHIVATADGLE